MQSLPKINSGGGKITWNIVLKPKNLFHFYGSSSLCSCLFSSDSIPSVRCITEKRYIIEILKICNLMTASPALKWRENWSKSLYPTYGIEEKSNLFLKSAILLYDSMVTLEWTELDTKAFRVWWLLWESPWRIIIAKFIPWWSKPTKPFVVFDLRESTLEICWDSLQRERQSPGWGPRNLPVRMEKYWKFGSSGMSNL